MNTKPVKLEGGRIRLEPLSLEHLGGLCAVGFDEEIWRWTMTPPLRTPEEMRDYIETALMWQREGTALPFAIIEQSSGAAIGSTRYANMDAKNRRLEIGWTWLGREWQRTAVNTEAKLLLLKHAFEQFDCLRVEFKTDSLNERSRRAILRIGAKEEGTLRNHMITPSGRVRHTVYYSVIRSEWPEVEERLRSKLARA